jgi:AraC-like DNA-binding protein
MSYRELAPPPALVSHVACLWLRGDGPRRVLPDGCADLVWTGEEVIVAGPATRATIPRVSHHQTKLGVRFRVGAAGVALGIGAAELRDRSPSLSEVWADGGELSERIAAAPSAPARLGLLVDAVAHRLAEAPPADPLVRAAALGLSRPRTRIAGLCTRLGISERQLRRRFEDGVGYPPRTLARVLRLQRFLGLAGRGGDLARLAAEAGYADQPHLTRDCARLAGLPAATLLATGVGPAGEAFSRA